MDANAREWRIGDPAEVRLFGGWEAGTVTRQIGGVVIVHVEGLARSVAVPVRCTESLRPGVHVRPWLTATGLREST